MSSNDLKLYLNFTIFNGFYILTFTLEVLRNSLGPRARKLLRSASVECDAPGAARVMTLSNICPDIHFKHNTSINSMVLHSDSTGEMQHSLAGSSKRLPPRVTGSTGQQNSWAPAVI
jgi:hypothetical protein